LTNEAGDSKKSTEDLKDKKGSLNGKQSENSKGQKLDKNSSEEKEVKKSFFFKAKHRKKRRNEN